MVLRKKVNIIDELRSIEKIIYKKNETLAVYTPGF